MYRRRRDYDFPLLYLGFRILDYGIDRIPPVTLGTIALNILTFRLLPYSVYGTCISAKYVLYDWDFKRLLLGTLDHGDSVHLLFNMLSLMWKGVNLERRFRSRRFAYILVVFGVLSGVTMVGLSFLLAVLTGARSYIHQCAVGFSGVLFGLLVLTCHYDPPGTRYLVFGIVPFSAKTVYWAELIIIQVLYPNASFTGHLAGILVGLAYIRGPLKKFMDGSSEPVYTYYQTDRFPGWENMGRGFTTGYAEQASIQVGGCRSSPTNDLSEEEQYQRLLERSRLEH